MSKFFSDTDAMLDPVGPRLHWSVQIYDRTNLLTGAVRLHGTGQSLLQIAIFF